MNIKKAFTFVELIVVVTILGILSTIGFISYTSGLGDARDSTRKSDIATIKSVLKQHKQSRGSYPIPSPGENFNLTVSGSVVVTQGKLDNKVTLPTLDNIPTDPKAKVYYVYSTTTNRQEYQLAATLENEDTPLALVDGDYSSVAKDTLPTIVVAWDAGVLDVTSGSNYNLFIFNNQYHNLPYDFVGDGSPVADGTAFADMLIQAEADGSFWQNSDFVSCSEIEEAGKDIGDLSCSGGSGCYQIVNTTDGTLTGTGCTF